jgi:hypothetical protein
MSIKSGPGQGGAGAAKVNANRCLWNFILFKPCVRLGCQTDPFYRILALRYKQEQIRWGVEMSRTDSFPSLAECAEWQGRYRLHGKEGEGPYVG